MHRGNWNKSNVKDKGKDYLGKAESQPRNNQKGNCKTLESRRKLELHGYENKE